MKNWEWFGNAGHLCVGHYCRFHLCTQVGEYLISTVGQYFPDLQVREILAKSRGIGLEGRGDEREADFMEKIGFQEIGYGRLYETMVFKAGSKCNASKCKCGMPQIRGNELDMKGYNNAKCATEGHLNMCKKYSKFKKQVKIAIGKV